MKRLIALFLLAASACFAMTARSTNEDGLGSTVSNNVNRLTAVEARETVSEARLASQEALLWEDLRFPAEAINQTGPANAPTPDTSNFYGGLIFSGSAENDVAFNVQMPHGYKNGTSLIPHMHVVNTSASTATTSWEFYYRKANVNGDFGTSLTGATITVQLGVSSTTHQMVDLPTITMTGMNDSAMLNILLRRLGTADASTGTVTLLEFDIHYQSDRRGSTEEHGDAQ